MFMVVTVKVDLFLEEKMKRRLNARIDYAKFLEDTLKEMAKEVQSRTSGEPQDLDEFLGKVRTGGSVANDEILGFAKLFKYCNSLAFLVKCSLNNKQNTTLIYILPTVEASRKEGPTPSSHWGLVIECLSDMLAILKDCHEQGHMDVMCIWAEKVLNKCFSIIERSGDVVKNSEGKPPFILAKRDFDNAYKDLETLRSGDVVINSEGKPPFILTNRDFDNAYKDLETLSFGMVRHMPVQESPANATVKDVLDRVGEGSYSWSPYGFSVKQELIAKLNHEVVSDPIDKLGMGDVLELTPKIPDKSLIEKKRRNSTYNQGKDIADSELLDYISESSTMSKSLAYYGEQNSCAEITARRLADFLGVTMVKDKGLRCQYVVAYQGNPVSEWVVPVAIFETDAGSFRITGIRYSLKDKNEAKPDKTEHGMEKF
ncbi:DNA polymerase epsilon catalytic subunit A-like protein [Tanacetum coccineum]